MCLAVQRIFLNDMPMQVYPYLSTVNYMKHQKCSKTDFLQQIFDIQIWLKYLNLMFFFLYSLMFCYLFIEFLFSHPPGNSIQKNIFLLKYPRKVTMVNNFKRIEKSHVSYLITQQNNLMKRINIYKLYISVI